METIIHFLDIFWQIHEISEAFKIYKCLSYWWLGHINNFLKNVYKTLVEPISQFLEIYWHSKELSDALKQNILAYFDPIGPGAFSAKRST